MSNHKNYSVVSVLIFIQVLFGVNFPASKVIVSKMDPILWSNLRFLLAGIGMLVLSLICRRRHPKVDKDFLKSVIPLSLLGMGLGQGLFLVGLRYTSAINAAILITSIPILTLLIVVMRRQEQLTGYKLIGFVLSFLGVILMRDLTNISFGSSTLLGDIFVLLGALCFALYLSYGKKFFMSYDNMWSTTWMFFISGIGMTFFNISKFESLEVSNFTPLFYQCAIFSIVGATLLTYLLNNWALKKANSGNVAIFIYLQPVVAGVIAFFFLGEVVSVRTAICSLFVLAGLLFSMKKQ